MMKILKRKNKKGFTLMEMLIVIGIIAVLVAIAIPTFNGANKKAKYAADVANVRAWYAEQLVANMTEGTPLPTGDVKSKIKIQMGDGATVNASGTSADTFKVIYDPNGTATDEANYLAVTFPTPVS